MYFTVGMFIIDIAELADEHKSDCFLAFRCVHLFVTVLKCILHSDMSWSVAYD